MTLISFKEYIEESEDYQGEHEPPDKEGGSPMHDVTKNGTYPHDFYSHVGFRYYSDHGESYDHGTHNRVANAKGQPEKLMSVFRAIPNDVYKKKRKESDKDGTSFLRKVFHPGSWVTPTKEYAHEHGKSHLGGKYKVVGMRVPAKHLYTDGNSIHEWGYHPD